MGIPKLLPFITERYPNIIKKIKANEIPRYDNLYVDMNGIVHGCCKIHECDGSDLMTISNDEIYGHVENAIETLYRLAMPRKCLFLAFDGVAPRAKWNKQRQRRFRVASERELTDYTFDTNCISPGTEFSHNLQVAIQKFITYKMKSDELWQNCQIILNGPDTPGEGTQKIFDYIRHLQSKDHYDWSMRHCVFSMDSDVIMLSVAVHETNLSILRNEVKLQLNSFQNDIHNKFELLHIEILREYIEIEFNSIREQISFEFDTNRIADDWVFMCFFIGNDFLPHLPQLEISENGIELLYKSYLKVMPLLDGYLHDCGILNMGRIEAFLAAIKGVEKFLFIESLEMETKANHTESSGIEKTLDASSKTKQAIPRHIMDDLLINFKVNYYESKFKMEDVSSGEIGLATMAYMRAIQWNLQYYFRGIPSWNWYYPYNYAPFASDLLDLFDTADLYQKFDLNEPVSSITHLLAILPSQSGQLLPTSLQGITRNELARFYPMDFPIDLKPTQKYWEAIVVLPYVCMETLEKIVNKYRNEFTDDELLRDIHQYVIQYAYTASGDVSIKQIESKVLTVRNHICTMKNKPICVFSTMKLLPFTADVTANNAPNTSNQQIQSKHVVTLKLISNYAKSDIENYARTYLNQEIVYGWPQLRYGKVVAISDSTAIWSVYNGEIMDESKIDGNKCNYAVEFGANVEHIKTSYRSGIDFGKIKYLIHIAPIITTEFVFESDLKYYEKQIWSDNHVIVPIQTIILCSKFNWKQYELRSLSSMQVLKDQCMIFLFDHKNYYGRKAMVSDQRKMAENGRIEIYMTLEPEPDLSAAKELDEEYAKGPISASYKNVQYAAASIGIHHGLFLRITGDVLVNLSKRSRANNDGTKLMNIGLKLKSNSQMSELNDYVRNLDGSWLYTKRAANLVNAYREKFPKLFEILNDKYGHLFLSDFEHVGGKAYLEEILLWTKTQPHSLLKKQTVGTRSLHKTSIDSVIEAVEHHLVKFTRSTIRLQVNPQIIYKPNLNNLFVVPDASAEYKLFDRVVCVRAGYPIYVGAKGTVVSIQPKKNVFYNIQHDNLYSMEILMDDPFVWNGQKGRVFKAYTTAMFLNISHGPRMP